MTPEEQRVRDMELSKQIAERIAPHLNECGVVGFTMMAYVADANGNLSRLTIGGHGADSNPAVQDALRPLDRIASLWSVGAL